MLVVMRTLLRVLFGRRADSPWYGYVPVLFALVFFFLLGFEDEGWLGMLPYISLIVVSALQLWYRSLVGWLVLLAACIFYGVFVALSPDPRQSGEWIFFMACGVIPAIILLVGRPRGVLREIWPRATGTKTAEGSTK